MAVIALSCQAYPNTQSYEDSNDALETENDAILERSTCSRQVLELTRALQSCYHKLPLNYYSYEVPIRNVEVARTAPKGTDVHNIKHLPRFINMN